MEQDTWLLSSGDNGDEDSDGDKVKLPLALAAACTGGSLSVPVLLNIGQVKSSSSSSYPLVQRPDKFIEY